MADGHVITVHRKRVGGGTPALEHYAVRIADHAAAIDAVKSAAHVTDETVSASGPLTQSTLDIFGVKEGKATLIQVVS